jgi:hypothetical protein
VHIDAPKALGTRKPDLSSVEMALTLLQAVKDVVWELLGDPVAEQSKATIHTCTRACDLFRTDLQRWTKHSEEGKLSWQDRANVECMINMGVAVALAFTRRQVKPSAVFSDFYYHEFNP